MLFGTLLPSGGGIKPAAMNLGKIYRDGHLGTKADLVKAKEIFQRFAPHDKECAAMAKNIDEEIAYNMKQKQNEIAYLNDQTHKR